MFEPSICKITMYDPLGAYRKYEQGCRENKISCFRTISFWSHHLIQIIINQFKRMIQSRYDETKTRSSFSEFSIQNIRYAKPSQLNWICKKPILSFDEAKQLAYLELQCANDSDTSIFNKLAEKCTSPILIRWNSAAKQLSQNGIKV